MGVWVQCNEDSSAIGGTCMQPGLRDERCCQEPDSTLAPQCRQLPRLLDSPLQLAVPTCVSRVATMLLALIRPGTPRYWMPDLL